MIVRCGSLATKARISSLVCQEVTLHHASFASPRALAPRLPLDFCACSSTATASTKNSSRSAGSFSRSLVTTITGTTGLLGGAGQPQFHGKHPARIPLPACKSCQTTCAAAHGTERAAERFVHADRRDPDRCGAVDGH